MKVPLQDVAAHVEREPANAAHGCAGLQSGYADVMELRKDQIAVVFISQRTDGDEEGYAAAAAEMDALAATQPGYRGIDSARGGDGLGITVSYWADEQSAVAWRNHPEHARIRDRGRGRWYKRYEVYVTQVTRGYSWKLP